MSTFDRDAARARAEAATPGPWDAEIGEDIEVNADTARTVWNEAGNFGRPAKSWRTTDRILKVPYAEYELLEEEYEIVAANAEFIAHARTDLPAALDIIDAVLALHPVEQYRAYGLRDGWYTPLGHGCPTCRTEGACPTRLVIEGEER